MITFWCLNSGEINLWSFQSNFNYIYQLFLYFQYMKKSTISFYISSIHSAIPLLLIYFRFKRNRCPIPISTKKKMKTMTTQLLLKLLSSSSSSATAPALSHHIRQINNMSTSSSSSDTIRYDICAVCGVVYVENSIEMDWMDIEWKEIADVNECVGAAGWMNVCGGGVGESNVVTLH